VDRAITVGDEQLDDDEDLTPQVEPGSDCDEDDDCADDQACFQGTCVGAGELRISLSWAPPADLDLHVRTPSGAEVDYETPMAGGGTLDVDDCVAGECNSADGPHVENVVFSSASSGPYEVWVENFDGLRGADFRIEVAGAHEEAWTGNVRSPPYDHSPTFEFRIP
jgi:hypothetical protein